MKRYQQPAPAITPLEDVPGPEADSTVLRAHYRRVQEAFATHRYNDVVAVCHWCLVEDLQRPAVGTRSPVKYCDQRCAEAAEAYYVQVLGKGQHQPPKEDLAETTARRTAEKKHAEREKTKSYGSGKTRA